MSAAGHWGQVRDLFERALNEEPSDLEAWLDRHGVADRELRAELLSLLAHHRSAGAFLAQPAAERLLELMADAGALEPGQLVGPYSIVRELGRGGMGRVYLATDTRLGRPVALKAISPELTANPSHRERLRREARAAGGLTHPGICTIYALEEIDGDLYIAAEFVDGGTLREDIDSGRVPSVAETARAAQELASALAAAHALGITHGDLKPENVMRTKDGRLKILDFGLARVETTVSAGTEPGARLTLPGAMIGTPAYMAPEQLNGRRADPRADIFALGVLLYEYAARTHPFDAATPLARIARILEGEATPIDTRRPDLPSPLAEVIGRCLRKSPDARFATAADVVLALERSEAPRAVGHLLAWWRAHQGAVIALYFVACALSWQVKEWRPGIAMAVFVATCIAATIGGVFRGHLLFAERVTGSGFAAARARAATVTLVVDLLVALALALDGAMLASLRPVASVLTIALGVGIALTRLVVEPATSTATFKPYRPG